MQRRRELGIGEYGCSYAASKHDSSSLFYRWKSFSPNPAFLDSNDDLLTELRIFTSVLSPIISRPIGVVVRDSSPPAIVPSLLRKALLPISF
jgi:hypothetical protein